MEKMVRLLHALPSAMPGKMRLARLLLARQLSARDVDLRTRSGLTIRAPSLREPLAFHLLCNGTYEPETISAIMAHLPQSGVFVDVGANIGAITLEIARQRPDARVLAVEASPAIVPYLQHNIEQNRLTNVHVVGVAASDHEGEIDFYLPPVEQFGMASTAPQFNVTPLRVVSQKLDDIVSALGMASVSVIKIDAEGAELNVIRGASELLKSNAPAVIFEFVDWAEARLHRAGDAQRELLALGYTISNLENARAALKRPMESGGAMLLARRNVTF